MLGVEPPSFVSKETRVQLNFQPDVTSLLLDDSDTKKVPGAIGVFCPPWFKAMQVTTPNVQILSFTKYYLLFGGRSGSLQS